MTEKDLEKCGIFLGDNVACIAQLLKSGEPGKHKRILTENEMANFVSWYINYQCKKLGTYQFTITKENGTVYTVIDEKLKKEFEELNHGGDVA